MKVTINTTAPQSREVDWSKPMVVESESGNCIITTGVQDAERFQGMSIRLCQFGFWLKSSYYPCTTPVTITFENEL